MLRQRQKGFVQAEEKTARGLNFEVAFGHKKTARSQVFIDATLPDSAALPGWRADHDLYHVLKMSQKLG